MFRTPFDLLSTDMIVDVLQFLCPEDLARISLLSRTFHECCLEDRIWCILSRVYLFSDQLGDGRGHGDGKGHRKLVQRCGSRVGEG